MHPIFLYLALVSTFLPSTRSFSYSVKLSTAPVLAINAYASPQSRPRPLPPLFVHTLRPSHPVVGGGKAYEIHIRGGMSRAAGCGRRRGTVRDGVERGGSAGEGRCGTGKHERRPDWKEEQTRWVTFFKGRAEGLVRFEAGQGRGGTRRRISPLRSKNRSIVKGRGEGKGKERGG